MKITWSLPIATFGIIAGNFLYSFCTDQNWSRAGERAYFQAMAIALFVFIQWIWEKMDLNQ